MLNVQGRKEAVVGMLFLAPALASLVAFRIVPAAWLIYIGFTDRAGNFVAFDNFLFLYTLPSFTKTVAATLTFVGVTVPLQTLVALALALLMAGRMPLGGLFRVLLFLPVVVPGSVAAILWGAAFRSDGLANALLSAVGISAQPFLSSPDQALMSLVIMASWVGVGYWMVFLIGGLKGIPQELYEAAQIDGAGRWSSFWFITLPLMRRPLAFVIVADTVAAFLLFAPVALLTRGGPNGSTQLIMYDIYQQAYLFDDIQLAAAEALSVMAIMITVIAAQFYLLSRNR